MYPYNHETFSVTGNPWENEIYYTEFAKSCAPLY